MGERKKVSKNKPQKSGDVHKISAKRTLSNNWFLLRIALQEAPLYTLYELQTHMQHELIVFLEHVYMIGFIIDSIQFGRPFHQVLWFVLGVFTIATVWGQLLPNYINTKIKPVALEKINRRLRLELYEKAVQLDLQCYDDPAYYNEFVWVMGEATQRLPKVLETCAMFIGCFAGIAVMGGYVLTQDPVGLLFTGVSVGITVVSFNLYHKLNLGFLEKLKPLERKRDYISRVFYLPEYAKELRLGQVKEKLYEEFEEATRQMEQIARRETKKMAVCSFVGRYMGNNLIFDGIYIIYLLFLSIVKKSIGYGTMVTLYNACGRLRNTMQLLGMALPQFAEHARYVEKIRHFLDTPAQVADRPGAMEVTEPFTELSLSHVDFSYPNGTAVLKDVSLTLHRGERIALVGYNGAGKTTLVKLLMRLYDVTGGQILRNGTDIRQLKLADYRAGFAALFQDYQLFAATLGENVTMDTTPIDEKKAEPLLKKSGFSKKFATLAKGYAAPLTREFEDEGELFSGGEAQMAAICRALYQDSRIIILDEPSSALDPLSEYNLNHTMMTLDRDKTVIFISHRLSTTRLADRIYMLEDGRIVEEGSHEELMAQNGRYAAMFRLQMEKYK